MKYMLDTNTLIYYFRGGYSDRFGVGYTECR